MIKLGVNIDHIATLRNARGIGYPNIIDAALVAEENGADFITVHLREDRRHINDKDVLLLKKKIKTKLNLEIAVSEEMLMYALQIKPYSVCFVPENREERTTEGGLDVVNKFNILSSYVKQLHTENIKVSLFINPQSNDIVCAHELGSYAIEIHTGAYSLIKQDHCHSNEYLEILHASKYAKSLGLVVNAGHGLDYDNVVPIAEINEISELNIGFSIVAKSVFEGLPQAVSKMKKLIIGV